MTRFITLIPCLLTGGTEIAALDTAKVYIDSGYQVEVFVYYKEIDPIMRQTYIDAGIKLRLLGLKRQTGLASSLNLAWSITRALGFRRYPLIWVQYMTPTLIPLLIARLYSRRLIAAVHVAANHYSPTGKRRLRWLATWWCDRFVCVSRTSMAGLFGDISNDRRLAERVHVIPNAIDMGAVEAATRRDWRAELGLGESTQLVGYVGRLAHNKGVDVLLKAAAHLAPKMPDVRWILVGAGEESYRLQALVDEARIGHLVHFVGRLPRDAVYGAMKGFDIAVVPSREEGFGLTALEAMACGVPLVASRVDSLREIVIEGKTGFLFALEDSLELADCIESLASNSEFRLALGTASARHAASNYGRNTFSVHVSGLLAGLGLDQRARA